MSEGDEHFLARWSRRKRQAKQAPVEAPAAPAPMDELTRPAVASQALPVEAPPGDSPQPQPLPPLESLTPESDFAPFMQAEVDPGVRRQALKTLFQDPQFNVMDGLDVYIDDYSKPDPLPEGWLAKMTQVARLGAYVEPVAEAEKDPDEAIAETPQASVAMPQPPLADIPQAPLAETPQAPLAEPPALAEGPAAEAEAESPEASREVAGEAQPQPEPLRKTTDGS
ncbi:MAG TPA: DUF3306 domain-containing protein [Usitatibacter sp.]|jgi:uncharacterized protein DUF3306|nr:DUF3306 domain-containing protein [Usitatibacter sp.]